MALTNLLNRRGPEIEALTQERDAAIVERDQARQERDQAQEEATRARTTAETATRNLSAFSAVIAKLGLAAENFEASLARHIEEQASRQLITLSASRGIATPIPEGETTAAPSVLSQAEAVAEMRKLSGEERTKFFQAHRGLILHGEPEN